MGGDHLRIVKKPRNMNKCEIKEYLRKRINDGILPASSKLSPKTNRLTWASEAFLIISKTTQYEEMIFSSKMHREFYIVTEVHADYDDEPESSHFVWGEGKDRFKQELEIQKLGLLHHRDAPGQKFCVYHVRGTSRSSLYNETYMYETLLQNNFIFTD